jgi:hypothetical protein
MCITFRITGILGFVHHPTFYKLENTTAQFPVTSPGLILLPGAFIAFVIRRRLSSDIG